MNDILYGYVRNHMSNLFRITFKLLNLFQLKKFPIFNFVSLCLLDNGDFNSTWYRTFYFEGTRLIARPRRDGTDYKCTIVRVLYGKLLSSIYCLVVPEDNLMFIYPHEEQSPYFDLNFYYTNL